LVVLPFHERGHAVICLLNALNGGDELPARPSARGGQARKPQRVGILVLGMHRSGTSALTRVLSLLGCDLPNHLMGANPTNEAGHWESQPICQLNDRILASAGSDWHDWQELNPGWFQSPKADEFREEALAVLDSEFGNSRLFVLKDPRICRLAPFWLDVLREAGAEPRVLLPVRNPLEVAASLHKRNGFDLSLGHLLWLRHILDAEFASRGVPRFVTSYDGMLGGWNSMAERAQAALGLNWPRLSLGTASEIDGFLADRYRHHHAARESVVDNPALSNWLRDSFGVLDDWARTAEEKTGRAVLDRIRQDFNGAAPAFGRLVTAGRQAGEKARALELSFAETTAKLSQAEAAASEHERKARQRDQQLAMLEAQVQRHAGEAEAVRTAAQARFDEIEAEAARSREAEHHAGLKLAEARQRLADREQQVIALQTEIAAQSAVADDHAGELAGLRDRLAQTESALAQRQLETEETAAELAGARAELRLAALSRAEGDKIATDLRAHIGLLLSDIQERNAAHKALEAANLDRARERDEALAAAGKSAEACALLEAEREELNRQLAAQAVRIASLGAEKTDLEGEVADGRRQLEASSEDRAKLEANVAERFREIAILTQHLDKAMTGEAAAVKERDDLRGRLAGRDKELGEATKERDGLRAQLAGRDKELGEARRGEQALSKKKAALEADISDRFAELATLTKLLAARDSELQRRAVQVEGFQTRVAEMERRVTWRLSAPWHALVDWLGVERSRARRLVAASGLFDAEWYKARYPDVAENGGDPLDHYMRYGWQEGRDPSDAFSVQSYVAHNPDIDPKKINALVHYIVYGRAEGRVI
jgi:hypothetical protein